LPGALSSSLSTRAASEADAPTLVARSGARPPGEWPKRAGAYELTRYLAAGGLGLVFEARRRCGGERVRRNSAAPYGTRSAWCSHGCERGRKERVRGMR
jgi:hypothetical protein